MIWLGLWSCTAAPPVGTGTPQPPMPRVATADTAPPYDPFAAGLVGDADRGSAAFGVRCAACHGAEGRGGLGPDLLPLVRTRTDLSLYQLIVDGDGAMPQINVEDDQEAVDIIAWLRVAFP